MRIQEIEPRALKICEVFGSCFRDPYDTELIAGQGEPLYVAGPPHRIEFAHGFAASALHEVSHWCLAGKKRRLCDDYGYWYKPDGRNAAEQEAFEDVEVKPQALEWVFASACGVAFNVSCDNLAGESKDSRSFENKILKQALSYVCDESSQPVRAQIFLDGLRRRFRSELVFRAYWQRVKLRQCEVQRLGFSSFDFGISETM